MLGLRPACGYQEVAIEYNKSLKLIHLTNAFWMEQLKLS